MAFPEPADCRPLAQGGVLRRRRSSSPRPTWPIRASWSGSARISSPSASRNTRTCCPWDAYWHTTLDTSNPPFWRWFVGGRLNACYNCVDRHLAEQPNKAALIWVPEPETKDPQRSLTRSCTAGSTSSLRSCVTSRRRAGDRVTFHLPMVPELPVSMLACARLGVIHSEVFGDSAARRAATGSPIGKPDPGDDGRLLPQRRAGRPQGQGRQGGGQRAKTGPRSKGAGVAPTPRRVRVAEPDGRRAGLLRRRAARRTTAGR